MTAERRSGIQFQRLFDLDNCIVISTCVIQEVRQSRLKERIQRIEFDCFFVFRNRLVQSTKPAQKPRIYFICPGQIRISSMARSNSTWAFRQSKAPASAQARERCASASCGSS